MRTVILLVLTLGLPRSLAAEPLPDDQLAFLRSNCLECHDADTREGDLCFEFGDIDWSDSKVLQLWERMLNAIQSGDMPPKEHAELSASERGTIVKWIDQTLRQHTPIGGTPARRLNQAEYKATVESLFGLKQFSLPQGFPVDRERHGFDNLGAGLVLSPPLLDSYAEASRLIADEIYPPRRTPPTAATHRAGARDLVISYSSGKIVNDAMRLGLKCDPIQRSCTWPSRIEAASSGLYQFSITLSTFGNDGHDEPMIVKVFARDVASQDGVQHKTLRLLKQLEVRSEKPETFQFETVLYEGQTPVILWANAKLDSDRGDKAALQEFFRSKDRANPRYLAAWNAMLSSAQGQGFRGGIGWERVKAQLARDDLPELSDEQRRATLKKIASNPVLYAETVVFDVFENGPALEVHELQLTGPREVVDGPRERESRRLQRKLVGDASTPEVVIRNLLRAAFRRPVDDSIVKRYVGIHDRHVNAGHTPDEAMHLVLRSVLISPRFLYRCLKTGPLDNHDLATRLAYFLTGRPPDARLRAKATSGALDDAGVARAEARRLLPRNASAPFIVRFTEQWLDTGKLSDIMPDQRFGFRANDEKNAKLEVEHFFFEMFKENRPMTDFIDPDFTWTSARIAKNVYELTEGFDKKKANVVHRVTFPRGGRHGGVLGQAAVMMATANGVDTQPVLRGAWVLENILGRPSPPPPNAVPPITPDTADAKTPRELLAAHTEQSLCAGCHRKIDPLGLVLENFDPVGHWRDEWPGTKQTIDAACTLPDGTKIEDVVDLKAWLSRNIDQFSTCLAGKLMTYATGRPLNYSERQEMATIVRDNHANGNGFQDLVLSLLQSQTFLTK